MKNYLELQSLKELGEQVESGQQIKAVLEQKKQYSPAIDYLTASNFVRFGLAEEYYTNSVKRIYKTYPYDGSKFEKQQWINESTALDKYIFNNFYPRTNGYGTLGNNWGTLVSTVDGYGAPASSSYEYIQVKGGPNLGFDLTGDRLSKQTKLRFENTNLFDNTKKRRSNLEFNTTGSFSGSNNGVTVEFWLKKNGYDLGLTSKEVLFDLWNGHSTSNEYGRLKIEMNLTASNTTFRVTCKSGSDGNENVELGTGTSTAISSVTNNSWNHYAFVFYNQDSGMYSRLYINGDLNQELLMGDEIQEVTGTLIANIGSIRTSPFGASGVDEGHGKLVSSSLDDFRFWKTKRTAEEIKKYYFDTVGGGTNTDDNTTKLGLYYKFNEGITQTSSVDSLVLDYSGRVSNGQWTGYSQALTPRSTGSAIIESSASFYEFKDPIVYSFHNDVNTLLNNLIDSGSNHDLTNNSALYYTLPKWILNEDANSGGEIKKLTQILASSLDDLFLKTEHINKYKTPSYDTDKVETNTLIKESLKSFNFVVPELFENASVLEYIENRSFDKHFVKSVDEVKNIIYQNIYNSLNHLYKTKGTEESYRNLLRCFGVGDDLVKINLYANDESFELKNSHTLGSKRDNLINFSHPDHFDATVYQSTASNDPTNSRSFVPTLGDNNQYVPFTLESQIVFPKKWNQSDNNFIYTNFTSSSLFGCHNALGTDSSNLTWQTPETASLQIYAVRRTKQSKDAKFVLTGTLDSTFPVLTSSFYEDVYDNDKWNFAVSIKPSKHPYVDLTTGSSSPTYILELYGVNTIQDKVAERGVKTREFTLTASLTNTQGRNFLLSDKRVYAGAHRTNFTGSLLTYSDVQVNNLRCWSDYIPTSSILSHAKTGDFGVQNPYQYAYLNNTDVSDFYIPKIKTLNFNWEFSTISSSNDLGQFHVFDETSGSQTDASASYGGFGGAFGYRLPGKGDFFLTSSSEVIQEKYLPTVVPRIPETVNSSDMINILNSDLEIHTKTSRPVKNILFVEKSPYQTISEDMIKWMETIVDYNNLIGHPVEKYRIKYKSLEKLRQLYFTKIQNTPDVNKFIEYYKWIDKSLTKTLSQLFPASLNVSEDVLDVVESHIFERNKFQHKFPLLETKPSTTGSMKGVGEFDYNWEHGHAPSPLNENLHGQWWSDKAFNDDNAWPSLTAAQIQDRKLLADVKNQFLQQESKKTQTLNTSQQKIIKGGINFSNNKNISFYKPFVEPLGPTPIAGINVNLLRATSSSLDAGKPRNEFNEIIVDGKSKHHENSELKLGFDVISGDDVFEGKGELYMPFNIVSSSVNDAHNITLTGANVENLHHELYGFDKEKPVQGIFTDVHVGGYKHRHIEINQGTDDKSTRPERFRIVEEGGDILLVGPDYNSAALYPNMNTVFSRWSRDNLAKSPINVKNIQHTTDSKVLGNYQHNYEVATLSGRKENNFYLRENNGITASFTASQNVTGLYDYAVPRRDLTGSNSVIVSKFSSPGSVETTAEGYLDLEAGEYSAYNALPYINLVIRNYLDELWATASNQFGIDNPLSPVSASFHKTNRNISYEMRLSGSSFITASKYDNNFVSRAIPRSDLQYSWIKKSALQVDELIINNQNVPFQYSSGSLRDGKHRSILFVSASDFGSYRNPIAGNNRFFGTTEAIAFGFNFIPETTLNLNMNIYEPITSSNNTLGFESLVVSNPFGDWTRVQSNYVNDALVNGQNGEDTDDTSTLEGVSSILNALNFKRTGPGGFTSWKQTRNSNHPITKWLKKNNVYSIVPENEVEETKYIEPPISYNLPLETGFEYNNKNLKVQYEHNNALEYFGNKNLKRKHNPEGKNKTEYNKIKEFVNANDNLLYHCYSEQVFPQSQYTSLSGTRARLGYVEESGLGVSGYDRRIDERRTFWQKNKFRSSISSSTPFKNAVEYRHGRSVHPLDNEYVYHAREDVLNSPPWLLSVNKINSGSAHGELNPSAFITTSSFISYVSPNEIGMYGSGQSYLSGTATDDAIDSTYYDNITASLQFVYMPNIGKFTEMNYPYDVPALSSKSPWFDSYEDYASDIKYNKEYSVLSEFNISDYMDYYIDENKGFNSKNNAFLKVKGGILSESSASPGDGYINDFFERHTNSDFMEHFETFRRDFGKTKKIKLVCKGVKKLLPYNGFYPTTRTTQLGAIFSQSLGPYISGSLYDTKPGLGLQSLLQPYFAPGIVFNTIKSGIAVDWPMITGSDDNASGFASQYLTASGLDLTGVQEDWQEYLLSSSFGNLGGEYHFRLPFESLVDIKNTLPSGSRLMHIAPDKILQQSGSANTIFPWVYWKGEKSDKFEMSMHNFLSEVPKFFLENETITTFASKPEKTFAIMKAGKTYYMDVVLRKTDNFDMIRSYFSGSVPSGTLGSEFEVSSSYHGRYFGPPVNAWGDGHVFGSDADSRAIFYKDPVYAPYTPPYFYGAAKVRLAFSPTETRKYTVDEIIASSVASSSQPTDQRGESNLEMAQLNSMRVESSVNLFGKGNSLDSDDSSGFDSWVIASKFECPTLNFNGTQRSPHINDVYSDDSGFTYQPAFLSSGIWGTYGSIPTGSEGIYLSLEESFPQSGSYGLQIASGSFGLTGSLIQACGFGAKRKRIGKLASKKVIKEAIVAIPYVDNKSEKTVSVGGRNFIGINKEHFRQTKQNIASNVSQKETSVSNMIKRMDKYYFPPFMDFSNDNNNINPFIIYIFEFSSELDKQDLSDIWQGVMPKIALNASEQEIQIEHKMNEDEFFGDMEIPEKLKWLVFKVKRKAGKNYFDIIPDYENIKVKTDRIEKRKVDYNYNWPYDFCSLVELANLKVKIDFGK